MFANKFGVPASAPATAPAAPPQRSRYGGIQCGEARDPMLDLGTYRVRIVSCTEGSNPKTGRASVKLGVCVVAASPDAGTPVDAVCTVVHLATPIGLGELKTMLVHAAGCGPTLAQRAAGDIRAIAKEGEARYDAVDASTYPGSIIEATAGTANGAPSMIGRLVDVVVTRGRDTKSEGDWYRNFRWGAVPEAEQIPA